jgi:hypothetical protein
LSEGYLKMGTNFYLRGWTYDEETRQYTELRRYSSQVPSDEGPRTHIGKRSAAGLYCWDCNETLVIGGKDAIHTDAGMYKKCPKCGKAPGEKSPFTEGAAAVELGFAKPRVRRPVGVQSCASFTWAQPEDGVIAFMQQHLNHAVVIDEYGRISSGETFLEMLECNCPVRFHDSVGQLFW